MGTNTATLENLLREHLNPREWALFFEVANSTGYRKSRTADALAMNLWPSAGLELHGFELKVSRSDWLRELKQPDKATEIARYCDRWWLVVGDESVVRTEELPAGWGLLVAKQAQTYDGARLKLHVERWADLRVCQAPDRGFIASLLRAAQKSRPAVVEANAGESAPEAPEAV